MPARKKKPVEANDGSYAGAVLAAYDQMADDYDDSEECWNCFGEGWIANCWEEYACVDPESGCDECMQRCDVCRGKGSL